MRSRLAITALLATVGIWMGCSLSGDSNFDSTYIQGDWEVSDVDFNQVVIRSYDISRRQDADSVALWRDSVRISVGEIRGDTLYCTDWDGYSIGRIFIDNWRRMRSETPGVELLNVVLFDRKVWPSTGGRR